MKWKTIFVLVSILTYTLDPETVKSPGSFDNVAPEADKIITPKYARPKVDLHIKTTGDALVQRSDFIGTTPVPMYGRVFDRNSGTHETAPYVDMKKLTGVTTNWASVDNYKKVSVDIQSGKVIPPLNVATEPKVTFGQERADK